MKDYCYACFFLMCGILYLGCAEANDSAYFATGNQLCPLTETEIAIKKEVLTMRRIARDKMAITVDYTFYNPAKVEKMLLMGFEANSPVGDVNGTPKGGEHPYIEQFRAVINGNAITHQVAIYDLDAEKLPARFTAEILSRERQIPKISNENETNFHYVYHFSAAFKPGDNSVKHTYVYALSNSVFTEAEMDYLLTPATRWANGKIDDFTLIVDMGSDQEYHIAATFFEKAEDWKCEGKVRCAIEDVQRMSNGVTSSVLTVWQRQGCVRFHARDFKPAGEFSLLINRPILEDTILNVAKMRLPFRALPMCDDCAVRDEFSRKVLRNLPYAQRGYVFSDQVLKDYYARQPWYEPAEKLAHFDLQDDEIEWRKKIERMTVVEERD